MSEFESTIRTIIREELYPYLPTVVMVSFEALLPERQHVIKIYWPEHQLSWKGRVEEHSYNAQELVRLSFNRNFFSRLLGRLVAPYVQSYISHTPVTLMPDTHIIYPAGRRQLVVEDTDWADKDYVFELVRMWARSVGVDIVRERGGRN